MSEASDRLTVHVLDTASGGPAAGMALTLRRDGTVLAEAVTNADGRCDAPLLAGAALRAGVYEIAYDVVGWRAMRAEGGSADLGFYDMITIRFVVGDMPGHLHIPLLLSPYSYSTYRGS